MKRSSERQPAWWVTGAVVLVVSLYGAYVVRTAQDPPGRGKPQALAPGFAGSAACAECHAGITAQHAATPHSRALRSVLEPEVQASLPEPQWLRDAEAGTAYRIAGRKGRLGVEAEAGGQSRWQPMHWAFGSGSHGRTLVGQAEDGTYVEAPLSFYRSTGWDFTVGFLGVPAAARREYPVGKRLAKDEAKECFHCHTTGARAGPGGIVLEGAQLGVQCESCHGPARAHVDAARRGRPKEGVMTAGRSSAQSMVTFCASCHRDSPPPGLKVTDPVVVRFAPVGLQQSACFRKSGGKLSCISCHDPHGTTSKDPDHYRRVCSSCHTGAGDLHRCPVRPEGDCVSCHMTRQIVQRNSIFTDHWIRVRRPEKVAAAGSDSGRIDLR